MTSMLRRRLLRLETVNGRRVFRHLSDAELDNRLRAELGAWLRGDPGACPADLRDELAPLLAAEVAPAWPVCAAAWPAWKRWCGGVNPKGRSGQDCESG